LKGKSAPTGDHHKLNKFKLIGIGPYWIFKCARLFSRFLHLGSAFEKWIVKGTLHPKMKIILVILVFTEAILSTNWPLAFLQNGTEQ